MYCFGKYGPLLFSKKVDAGPLVPPTRAPHLWMSLGTSRYPAAVMSAPAPVCVPAPCPDALPALRLAPASAATPAPLVDESIRTSMLAGAALAASAPWKTLFTMRMRPVVPAGLVLSLHAAKVPMSSTDAVTRRTVIATSMRRRSGCGIALGSQPAPARVLIGFRCVGILVALQPEAVPIDGALLRRHALPRFHQDVRALGDVDQLGRLALREHSRVRLPFLQHRRGADGGNPERRSHMIEAEPRRALEPLRVRRAPRPAAVHAFVVRAAAKHEVLHVT